MHSYINNIRFSNTEDFNEYLKNYKNSKIIQEEQEEIDKKKEYMLLGLRKIKGVSIQEFKNKFGENPIFLFKEVLNKLVNSKKDP